MIWGIGTGRCGTKSLAADLGGVHEPTPWLGHRAVEAYRWPGQGGPVAWCWTRIKERRESGEAAVVDAQHSYVIPLIRQVDPAAEFAWVIRNPQSTAESLIEGGVWTEQDGNGRDRWAPAEGWLGEPRVVKAAMYYRAVMAIILSEFERRREPWRILHTPELQAHENGARKHKLLSEGEVGLVWGLCGAVWNRAVEARYAVSGPPQTTETAR